MKTIPLTKNKVAIVDDEDYVFLNQWKWHYHREYAARAITVSNGKQTRIYMHDILMPHPSDLEVDHINRNGIDNRKSNLRIVTHKQNADNRREIFKNNTSGVKGVCFHNGKWQASYRHHGHLIYIGRFDTIEQAKEAYETTKSRLTKE